jgi:hypothetical protein
MKPGSFPLASGTRSLKLADNRGLILESELVALADQFIDFWRCGRLSMIYRNRLIRCTWPPGHGSC